jgi:hypothetical protein
LSRGIDSLVDGAFAALSGGAGRSAGGLFGLGNFLGFLDGGGRIRSGEFAVVGELRPEIVVGPAQVIGGAETARMMGSGARVGGTATIRLIPPEGFTVQQEGRVQGIALQVTGEALQQYDRETLPGSVQRIERDPLRVG